MNEEEVFLPGTETRESRGEAEILAEIPISTRKFCVPPFVPVRTAAHDEAMMTFSSSILLPGRKCVYLNRCLFGMLWDMAFQKDNDSSNNTGTSIIFIFIT